MATGSSDREIKISVVVDANGAVKALTQLGDETKKAGKAAEESSKGFTKFEAGIVSLNQGLELAKKGFSLISNSFNQLSSALSRGDQFNSLTQNIRQLTSESGKLSDAFEQRLFKAIDGNITNFDALKTSVGGLQLGLDQNLILDYAASADKLGDAVGISAADAFNTLVNAVGKHNARLLESVGISLDGIDVNQRYANSIGVSVRDLTEQQKAEAQSVASKELIKIKLSELANVSSGAGENLGKVSNQIINITDAAYASLDSNQQLAAAFQNLFNTLKGFDWNVYLITPLTNVINTVANVSQNLQNIQAAFLASSLKSVTFKDQLLALNGAMKESFKSGKDFNEALQENGALAKAVILNYGTLSADLKTKFAPNVQFLTKALNGEITALKKTDTEVKKTNKGHKDYGDTNRALNKTLSEQIDLLNKSAAEVEKLDKALADGLISPQQFELALSKINEELTNMGFSGEQATNAITKGLDAGIDSADNFNDKLNEVDFLDNIRNQAEGVSSIIDGISTISDAISGGLEENKIQEAIVAAATIVGGIIGATGGNVAGGAAAGAALGQVAAPYLEKFYDAIGLTDSGATKARKNLTKYLNEILDTVTVVIDTHLRRLKKVVDGGDLFGDPTSNFYNQFNQLSGAAKDAFRAVGIAFGGIAGISQEIASTFGAVFANNIGPSLNNLQILVEASGVSFEELGSQIEKAFLTGELSITQARLALIGLEKTAEKGIPDAIGASTTAFENLINAGLNGGRASVDALKDIVYEAKELGITNFAELRKFIRDSGDFSSKEIKALFGALKDIRVSNFDQLTSASLSTIIAVLTQFNSRGGFDEATAKLEDTATAINNVPNEKKVKFIIDVDYTDRAKSLTAQAALANINAPTVKRAEGVR